MSNHKEHSIEKETMLMPATVADNILAELEWYLGEEIPCREYIRLTVSADARRFYAQDEHMRKLFRRRVSGRDWLWSFMRHWTAGPLKESLTAAGKLDLFYKVPNGYWLGNDLPIRTLKEQEELDSKLKGRR